METQISSNLERCSEIADQLQDCSWSTTGKVAKEVLVLAQELERLIEDLFVMTGAEAAREVLIDQQLLDAGRDPNAGVERALSQMSDASDIIAETIKNLNEVYRAAMMQGEKQR